MKNISLIAFYYTLKSNKTPLKLWIPLNTIDNKFFLCKIRGIKKAFKRNRQKMWGKGERRGKKGKRMEKRGNGKRQLKKCVWAMNKKNSIAECNGEMVTISRWIWNLFAHKKSSLLCNRSWFTRFDKWSGCVCARNPALKLNYILYCKNE